MVIRAVTRATRALNRKGRKERKDNLFILCYRTNPSFAFFASFAVNPRCRKEHCSDAKRQARPCGTFREAWMAIDLRPPQA